MVVSLARRVALRFNERCIGRRCHYQLVYLLLVLLHTLCTSSIGWYLNLFRFLLRFCHSFLSRTIPSLRFNLICACLAQSNAQLRTIMKLIIQKWLLITEYQLFAKKKCFVYHFVHQCIFHICQAPFYRSNFRSLSFICCFILTQSAWNVLSCASFEMSFFISKSIRVNRIFRDDWVLSQYKSAKITWIFFLFCLFFVNVWVPIHFFLWALTTQQTYNTKAHWTDNIMIDVR